MSQSIIWPAERKLITPEDVSMLALWNFVNLGENRGKESFMRDWKHAKYTELSMKAGIPHVHEDTQ